MRYSIPARPITTLREMTFSVVSTSRTEPPNFPRTLDIVVVPVRGGQTLDRIETRLKTTPSSSENSGQRQIVSDLLNTLQDTVIASFDLTRDTDIVNFMFSSHGMDTLGNEKLSIRRLSRSLLCDLPRYDLETVANHFKVRHLEPMTAVATANTVADILIELLRAADERGISSLEDIKAFMDTCNESVEWRRYAFDRSFIQHLPPCPGVYIMKDRRENVIYVGKAVSLRERVATYFTGREEERVSGLRDTVFDIDFERTGSVLMALLREAELIFALKPEFNTVFVSLENRKAPARKSRQHGTDVKSLHRQGVLILLPSVRISRIDLVLLTKERSLWQGTLETDFSNFATVTEDLQRFLDTPTGAGLDTEEDQMKSIVEGWLARNEDIVNVIELHGDEKAAAIGEKIRPFIESGDWHGGKVIYRL